MSLKSCHGNYLPSLNMSADLFKFLDPKLPHNNAQMNAAHSIPLHRNDERLEANLIDINTRCPCAHLKFPLITKTTLGRERKLIQLHGPCTSRAAAILECATTSLLCSIVLPNYESWCRKKRKYHQVSAK